jgi:hypothetical protein
MPKYQIITSFDTEEEMRAHLGATTRAATAVTAPAPVVEAPAAVVEAPAEVITAERDADGMPWSADYHSTPKSFTADGLWRSKRGSADAASAARAAFKAAGGTMTPAAMPTGMPTAAAMPTAPAAILPPPITFERLVNKITGMMQRGTLAPDAIPALYAATGGGTNPQVYETNETARAALYGQLSAIEPDLS